VLGFSAPIKTYGEPAVVRWNAVDDGAGVRGFDLSVLIDGITRTQVLTQSTATSYMAGVLPSHHFYEWQLVAWDHVNNAVTRTVTMAGVQATKTYYSGASRVAVRENGVLSYLHSDQLSSVSASTDASGRVVGRQLFEPFGAVRATFGEVNGSWGWATHRKTEDTGLTFMRARWYAPGVARFVSPDSVVPGAENPQAFNRYSYSRNSPLSRVDPTGHADCWIFQAICDFFDPPKPRIQVTIYPQPTSTSTPIPATATPRPTPTATPSPTATPQATASIAQGNSVVSTLINEFNPYNLILPVSDIEYNNGFGDFVDGYGQVENHDGYDVRSATGDKSVMAMASGEVLWVHSKSASVGILSESGLEIQYTHLDTAHGNQLVQGQKMQQGEKIGNYGLYGRTNYEHLHVTLRSGPNRVLVDPGEYWPGGRPSTSSWTFGTYSSLPTVTPQSKSS